MAGHRPSTSGWWAEGPSPTCEVRGLFPAVVPGNVGDLQYPVSIFILEVLKMIFNFFLAPSPPGGPGGGSGVPFSEGNRRFWADSGLNPVIFNFNFGLKHS
jgi:hypothetical protein